MTQESDSTVPLVCAVCDTFEVADGIDLVVTETGEALPDADDEWYLHLHTDNAVTVEDYDEDNPGRAVTDPDDWYMFCPDCRPSNALPTATEDPQFDIDIYIEQEREALDDD